MTRAALVLAVGMACVRVAAAVEPLKCPAGTKLESRTDSRQRLSEFCVDEQTGLKSGPQRDFRTDGTLFADITNDPLTKRSVALIYDERGALTEEAVLEKGKIVERRLTLLGMNNFVADLAGPGNSPGVTYRAIDDRTVGVDFHFEDADPVNGREKLEGFRSHTRHSFCKLLQGPVRIDSIQIRVLNDRDAEPAMSTELKREDCQPTG